MSLGDRPDIIGVDDASFEEFVAGSSGRLFTMALLLTGRQRAEAEDLLQDVLERAYRRWGKITRKGDPEPYVRQMLVNAAPSCARSLPPQTPDNRPDAKLRLMAAARRVWGAVDDIERRLRAAMISAAEPPPAGLLEGIRRRHRRHVRRLSFGCLAVAAAIGLAVPPLTHTLRAAPASVTHGSRARPTLTPTSPAPSPTAAPGTLLLTCDSANWGQLASNWRAGSLKVGPLWFVGGRQGAWVHHSGSNSVGRTSHGHGKPSGGVMIVEVASGSTVVMKVAPEARSYFRFLDGFGPNVGYKLPNGDTGFTFIACPRGETGPNGHVTDFYLGFSSRAGSRAPVDVWTSPSTPRPVRVIFTPR